VSVLGLPSSSNVATGTIYYLNSTGFVFQEQAAGQTLYDIASGGPAFVPSTWTSPWIKSTDLQGWSQWGMLSFLFGSPMNANDLVGLTISIAYNYSTSPTQSVTFSYPNMEAWTTPLTQFAIKPNNIRAEAFQITIADSIGADGFAVLPFEHIRVDYNIEPEGFRMPTNQQG
jgi:hypothetical protein